MKENIKTISVAVIAVAILFWVGYTVASKYFDMQTKINQIVTFLNSKFEVAPATK